jgi:GT2 family glycosyltransferase
MTSYLLSVSIVVFKPDRNVLKKTLSSLLDAALILSTHGQTICYIINNTEDDSEDDFLEALTQIFTEINLTLIQNRENKGYGYGNNLAITQSTASYHLVLNPDVFITPAALLAAYEYMEAHTEVGLVCPAVFGEEGERHYVLRQHPTLLDMFLRSVAPGFIKRLFAKRMARFEMRDADFNKEIVDIPSPTGCFMFFRNRDLKAIDGFDTDYFLYYEDSDIGRRLSKIAKIVYVPAIKIVHLWQRGTHKSWRMRWITIQSGLTYFRKWGGWW